MPPAVNVAFPSAVVFLLVSAAAPRLRAEPAAESVAEARSLFSQAVALEGASDFRGAAVKLESALALKETPGLRYHLAHCQEQSGALVAASRNYERASELIRGGAQAPDVEPLLPVAARRLEARLAKLELALPPDAHASVEVDGQALPAQALDGPIVLDPGPHRVLVRSPGHADFRADLSFTSGEQRAVRVLFDSPALAGAAGPHPPAPVSSAPASTARGSRAPARALDERKIVLASEAVITLLGVGLGAGFMAVRSNAADRADAAQAELEAPAAGPAGCASAPVAACTDLRRALDEHQRATTIATASFIGAGVAAGALALTWALWPNSRATASLALRPQAAGLELRAGGAF